MPAGQTCGTGTSHWISKKKFVGILFYKVVRVFYLKLKILITSEPIGFYHLGKHHIGPVMVLSYVSIPSLALIVQSRSSQADIVRGNVAS